MSSGGLTLSQAANQLLQWVIMPRVILKQISAPLLLTLQAHASVGQRNVVAAASWRNGGSSVESKKILMMGMSDVQIGETACFSRVSLAESTCQRASAERTKFTDGGSCDISMPGLACTQYDAVDVCDQVAPDSLVCTWHASWLSRAMR